MPPRTRRAAGAANPPATPAKTKGTKRGASSAPSTPQPKKQATSKAPKTGLAGTPAPNTSTSLGRIDPSSNLSGSILTLDGTVYDVMLNLVDISKNSDKYYILQLVECTDGKLVVYTRWGRTGTSGSMQTEDCADQAAAIAAFAKKFKAKTGVAWEDRDSYAPQAGKYEWAVMDHSKVASMWNDAAKWQYWIDDGVDGKPNGWYDYDEDGSAVVEQLFHEFTCNVHMYQRIVESGVYSYLVDLSKLQQTNVIHPAHTTRHIRRWTPALGSDQTPPGQCSAPALPAKAAKGGKKAAAAPPAPPLPPPINSTPTKAQVQAQIKKQMQTPVKSQPAPPVMASPKVDPLCKLTTVSVYLDYNAVLNQTNLADGANNNKFYKIQLLEDSSLKGKNFFVWTHWGRVGEDGQSKLDGGFSLEDGITEFGKKFKSKTANAWENRDNFVHKAGKYDLVETEEADEQAPAKTPIKTPAKPGSYPNCKLDAVTQELVEFIFSEDMFNDALTEFDIDVQKMPLGSLSQAQVQKGYDVLLELDEAIKARDQKQITALTGRFYTVIPHSFGRQRPPLIDTHEKVAAKISMCDVLSDIETAQEMMKDTPGGSMQSKHPSDELYDSLMADLALLPPNHAEYKVAQQYCIATMGHKVKLLNIWKVGRHDEDNSQRKEFTKLGNHKLLWHGTNVAVVAAILKSGLRIMPHSGGRVGKGIYLASEHAKSAWYVSTGRLKGKTVGIMFLAEAALGKQSIIDRDDSSLKAPPKGFDSVLAKGEREPDVSKDTTITLDGIKVAVPQGKPVKDPRYAHSSFSQSEYLVYNEKQQRLRYMLTFEW